MLLNLTDAQRNQVKITYNSNTNCFEVHIGRTDPVVREYPSVKVMLAEFQENGIGSADFDDEAHRMFKQGMEDNPYIAV